MSVWRTFLARLSQQIWMRLALFTVIAVALALVAGIVQPLLPGVVSVDFGQSSVSSILRILATSMLAVTTFSLAAMISAYSSAAAAGTPRATQLLVADRTSQNALSTFLGSFVFSIVGIVALSTGYYGEQGRTILYFGTLVVIAVVVITLMQWISHLTGFGRMSDVIDRVEAAAIEAVCAHSANPHLGGAAPVDVPTSAHAIPSAQTGCLTGIAVSALQGVAEDATLRIHIAILPGCVVGLGATLAYIEGTVDDEVISRVREAFRVESHRTFDQDPRLGLVALAEVASRALSPATNDPGTAIEVLDAVQRVLTREMTTAAKQGIEFDRVHVPATQFGDLIEDALRPIARDGAAMVEVDLRLQSVLAALIGIAAPWQMDVLVTASHDAEARSLSALTYSGDVDLVRRAARDARTAAS